jgi:hypothetical protein
VTIEKVTFLYPFQALFGCFGKFLASAHALVDVSVNSGLGFMLHLNNFKTWFAA